MAHDVLMHPAGLPVQQTAMRAMARRQQGPPEDEEEGILLLYVEIQVVEAPDDEPEEDPMP